MAEPQRTIITITRMECTGWRRIGGGIERIAVHAVLSDGSESPVFAADMRYEKGLREGIIERAMGSTSTPNDYYRMIAIRNERDRKKQELYGQVQQRYGQGLVDPCQP